MTADKILVLGLYLIPLMPVAIVIGSLIFWPPGPAGAQTVREVFQKVAP